MTPAMQLPANTNAGSEENARRQRAEKHLRRSMGGLLATDPDVRAPQALSATEGRAMLDRLIKLTAENKINKDNAFDMKYIDHLPDIIKSEGLVDEFSFHRTSCGLDAGVRIYSKRVDATYDMVYKTMYGIHGAKAPGDAAANESDDEGWSADTRDQGEDGSASQQTQQQRKRRQQAEAKVDPSATLADAESLKDKKVELTFDSDPLFNRTTKLFDENSAAGLLMLNLGIFKGCQIMFGSDEVPMAQFPTNLAQKAADSVSDAQVFLGPIRGLMEQAGQCSITPAIAALYEQLGDAGRQAFSNEDVLMAALAEDSGEAASSRDDAYIGNADEPSMHTAAGTFMPASSTGAGGAVSSAPGGHAAAGAAATEADSCYLDAAAGEESFCNDGDAGAFDTGFDVDDDHHSTGGGAHASYGLGGAADSFIGLQEDDATAGLGAGLDGEEDEEQQASGNAALSADALQWLVNAGKDAQSLRTTAGLGGASFWRFRSGPGPAGSKAAAGIKPKVATRARRRPAEVEIDFSAPCQPPAELRRTAKDPKDKEICIRRVGAAAPRNTLQPEDSHYQGSQLFQLSTCPGTDAFTVWRQHQAAQMSAAAAGRAARARASMGAGEMGLGADMGGYAGDDDDDFGGGDFGGQDFGGEGDGLGNGADGMVLDDMAAAAAAAGMQLDPLLQDALLLVPVPRKVQKLEINYDRTAKQVDVRALKDALHQSMHQLEEATASQQQSPNEEHETQTEALSFREVVQQLPEHTPAGPAKDISIHLCFICLLHLANEQGLRLDTEGRLDSLQIYTK